MSLNRGLAGILRGTQLFTAYTPTLAAGAGVFTTATPTGRWCRFGKLVFVEINIAITTNGTAATSAIAGLPFTSSTSMLPCVLAGRENVVAGKMLQGIIAANATTVTIVNYDNSYPGSDGATLCVSGCYESA